MQPFRPYADRPEISMTYYEVPAEVLEDAAQLVSWSRRSVAAARAATRARHAARPKSRRPGRRKVRGA
jgi:TfoX/Sxy family transcriptional regulator of competence genes